MRLLVVPALALSLLATGCQTTGKVPAVNPDVVGKIQREAQKVCSFLPDAHTIAAILASFNATAAVADALAHQIAVAVCGAVASGTSTASLHGVRIHGKFK